MIVRRSRRRDAPGEERHHEPSYACCIYADNRRRARARHAGSRRSRPRQPAAGGERQHGPHGQEQARKMLRNQRCGQERLRGRRAFLRRSGNPSARYQVVRASSRRRLRQDPGRQDHRDLRLMTPMRPPTVSGANLIPAKAGIGLRFQHHQVVLDTRPDVAWMEVHTENYMGGGTPLRYLDAIRRDTPISLHGVGLSLGSAEGIDPAHLERIRKVAERIEPGLMSEHIAWNVVGGTYLADLLPLPMTEEALEVVCRHVDQTQTYLKRRILVENPSTYIAFGNSIIPEWEFMTAVAARTGCGILCDVNNICVSAHNHGWDASAYIAALPTQAVGEEVWSLYRNAIARFGAVPTLIEWDNDVPPLDVLLQEADHAAGFIASADGARHADAA